MNIPPMERVPGDPRLRERENGGFYTTFMAANAVFQTGLLCYIITREILGCF
jgi:hypothetical protein